MSGPSPSATVIVPTHDHASTLDLAIRSALAQTVEDLEVVVIGDGVGDDTRDVMAPLLRDDGRLRFLDRPKGESHGELYRGRAVDATRAEIVCYLCDDDLLLPEHVETMAELLANADLAHSLNGYVDVEGDWCCYWGDLGLDPSRAWVLRPDRNFVSLTGTAHTTSAYRRLPYGWRSTPRGRWVDHYMWQQFLEQPWVSAVTGTRVTALQFPSHLSGRDAWSPLVRREELRRWAAWLAEPEGRSRFEETVRRALVRQGTEQFLAHDHLVECRLLTEDHIRNVEHRAQVAEEGVADLQRQVAEAGRARDELERRLCAAEDKRGRAMSELNAMTDRLAAMEATRTWRLRDRVLQVTPDQVVSWVASRHRTRLGAGDSAPREEEGSRSISRSSSRKAKNNLRDL